MIDWNYDEKTKMLTISGSGKMENYVGKKAPWFKLNVSGVIVNNGITNIGDYAFHFFSNLTSAVIPDSVTRIGKCAFEFCSSLSSVIIPDNVEYIGYGAFSGCKKLKEITIPISIKKIEDHVFDGCSSLNSITLINNNGKAHITIFHNEDVPLSKQIAMIINKDYSAKMKSEVKYDLLWQLFKLEPDEKLLAYIKNDFTGMIRFAIDRNDVETIKSVCKDGRFLTDENIDDLINQVVKSNNRPEISTILMNYKNKYFGDKTDKLSINNKISVSDFDSKNKNKEKSATSGFYGKELKKVKWSYHSDSGLLKISGMGEMDDYYGNNKAPWAKFDVEKVIIGNGVTSIGKYAFFNCSNLTSVTIPNSVTCIGICAFSGCSNLASVIIPNSVTNIGGYAFINCKSLTSVTIPDSVTDIGKDAFDGCKRLRSIIISYSVTSSVKSALSKYENLINIDYNGKCGIKGDNLKWSYDINSGSLKISGTGEMKDYGDKYNKAPWFELSIKKVIIGNGVTSIGRRAFFDCSSLTSVTIPNSVTSIGWGAFRGCSSLTSVIIPNNVTSIGQGAFRGCSSLTYVIIPNNVTSIGRGAFLDCSNLTSVTIPNSVTSIGGYAFINCKSLTSVTIPDSVTDIGKDAFDGCDSLRSIITSDRVTSSVKCALSKYENLMPIVRRNIETDKRVSVTNMSEDLNYRRNIETDKRVSDLTNMLEDLDYYDYYGKCGIKGDNLKWSYDINSGSLEISGTGEMKDYDAGYNKAPWFKLSIKKIIIEDGVTSIGKYAFFGCSSLTSVTIPNSVTRIGICAFSGCSSLIYENLKLMFRRNIETEKEVSDVTKMPKYLVHNGLVHNGKCGIVGDNLKWSYDINSDSLEISGAGEIKDYDVDNKAPWAKFDIEKVIIEDGVTSIGRFAFYSCSSLTSVTIPDSVTYIGYKAFSGTSWLNAQLKASPFVIAGKVVIASNPKTCVGDIVIPDGVTSIVFWAFSNCTYLKHLTIPKSVICIGYGAFYHCNSLISVTIPESVITISDNAFEGCENLTIYGKTGSKAQIFATEHSIKFESI